MEIKFYFFVDIIVARQGVARLNSAPKLNKLLCVCSSTPQLEPGHLLAEIFNGKMSLSLRHTRWSTPESDCDLTQGSPKRETAGFPPAQLPTPVSTPQPMTPKQAVIETSRGAFGLRRTRSDGGEKKRPSNGGGEAGRYPIKREAVVERLKTDVSDLTWDLTTVDFETLSTYDWRMRTRLWLLSLEASLSEARQGDWQKVHAYLGEVPDDSVAPIAPGTPLQVMQSELSAYVGLLSDVPLRNLRAHSLFQRYDAEDALQEVLRETLGVRESFRDIRVTVGSGVLSQERAETIRLLECQWALFQDEFMSLVKDRLVKAETLDKRCPAMMTRVSRENKLLKRQIEQVGELVQAQVEDAMSGLSVSGLTPPTPLSSTQSGLQGELCTD